MPVFFFITYDVASGQVMAEENRAKDNELVISDYYKQPGIMTEPGEYHYMLKDMPNGIPELCKTVQGLILHIFWSEAYGVKLSNERKKEVNLRKFEDMLARIVELDERPISTARSR